jgi:hypothetical protein
MTLAPTEAAERFARLRLSVEPPPVVEWEPFYTSRWRHSRQGQHQLFVGPTQSGKTLLCRQIARLRNPGVMLGTKPVDDSLDEYVEEGYVRIDHWPPRGSDYRKLSDPDIVRFILWPKIVKREQLRGHRPAFKDCLDSIFIEGRWCIVADEGLWLCAKKGLDLGTEIGDIAYGSASNKVSLYLCVQRPANIPPIAWTSVSDAYIFHMGRTDDVRELASLGIYPPGDVIKVVQSLRGHEFLYLPCRGGGGNEWSISQVRV